MTIVDFGNFVAHVRHCNSPSAPPVYVCLSTCSKPNSLRGTCILSLQFTPTINLLNAGYKSGCVKGLSMR